MGNKESKTRREKQEQVPLADALGRYSLSELEALFARGRISHINEPDSNGKTPLSCVYLVASAALLLKYGADVDARDRYSETRLFDAAQAGDAALAQFLLESGADVHARSTCEATALHRASSAEIVRLLVAHGADVNAVDKGGKTPLFEAVGWKDAEVIEALISAGADVTHLIASGESILFGVSFLSKLAAVEMLVEHGASVSTCSRLKGTPLHAADSFTLRRWMSALADLCPNLRDVTSVCEGLVLHLERILDQIEIGGAPGTKESYSALRRVALRIWKWMLEYEAMTIEQRILYSPRCFGDIDALHGAIFEFDNAFQLTRRARRSNSDWNSEMRQKWSERLREKPEAFEEMSAFIDDELDKCLHEELPPHDFWRKVYAAGLALETLRGQELVYGDFFLCKFTDPSVDPPESRAGKVPASSATDVYLLGIHILHALTEGNPWGDVSAGVARLLMGAGRLPSKPTSISVEQWQLIEAMCTADPAKRMELAQVVATLRQFSIEAAVSS